MKKIITTPNRVAAYLLSLSVFVLSCRKNHDNDNNTLNAPYEKQVICFNKNNGDSLQFDSKGRLAETRIERQDGTYYEYISPESISIKHIDRLTGKPDKTFMVTLQKNRVKTILTKYYDHNSGQLTKEFTTQFEYDANDHLVKIIDASWAGADLEFTYSDELPVKLNYANQDIFFEYDMNHKLSVAVPNGIYSWAYDDFEQLMGLFLNGSMGKMPLYAFKKVSSPLIWQAPVNFDLVFGANGELLTSDASSLSPGYSNFGSYRIDLHYKNITVKP